jgi:hypothetical protein
MNIIDRTAATAAVTRTRNGRNIYSDGNPRARRNVAAITGIILHQTDFFSTSISRFDYVIANYIVMVDGTILFVRPLDAALNSIGTDQRAIDIEIVGDYPSSDDLGAGATATLPTRGQITAARDLVGYLKSQHGVSYIYGHRQFTTKNCPGPHLWYNVGEWAIRNGMSGGRRGRPVPSTWTDSAMAIPGV